MLHWLFCVLRAFVWLRVLCLYSARRGVWCVVLRHLPPPLTPRLAVTDGTGVVQGPKPRDVYNLLRARDGMPPLDVNDWFIPFQAGRMRDHLPPGAL
jgi:hypothetical protein